MVDLAKRTRIMTRSQELGHCICNPQLPCPCEVFLAEDICHCAGERREAAPAEGVRLTALVESAGCASKIGQDDLRRILADLPPLTDPHVLVSSATRDDAAVYQLDQGPALVLTVDVFTPNVDDPYTFGQVAAANSVSDVYAMGGRPLAALSIIGFPADTLPPAVMTAVLRGGLEKLGEAGVPVVGGHSLKDAEIKFGFAVVGVVDPARMVTNAGARPGDRLVLTKPLGVGAIAFAAQLGRATAAALERSAAVMTALNRAAAEAMLAVGVHAATDVTGFGLLGHLGEMAAQSGVTAEIWADRVPALPAAREYLAAGMISGAAERNREAAGACLRVAPGVGEGTLYLLCDPQTSGGLLLAVPEAQAERLLAALRERGVPDAALIGRITEESEGTILVKTSESGAEPEAQDEEECCCCEQEGEEEPPCCCEEEL
jgi:selenide,water dikinase